jgi:hypothetical protein
MSDTINLVKEKAEKVTISLAKKGVTKVPSMRVASAYDVSGSMQGLYRNGTVQKAADQVLGVAYKFDDDGQVDSFIFDSRAAYVGTSSTDDYGTFVANTILNRSDLWSSTVYGTCLNLIMDFMFGAGVKSKVNVPGKKGIFGFSKPTVKEDIFKSSGNDPVLVLFFTDGSPDSGMSDSAFRIIKDAQDKKKPIYFNLIGIGGANFAVLKKLADDFDNCGFVSLSDINMTDEKLYDALVGTDEFIDFIKLHGAS